VVIDMAIVTLIPGHKTPGVVALSVDGQVVAHLGRAQKVEDGITISTDGNCRVNSITRMVGTQEEIDRAELEERDVPEETVVFSYAWDTERVPRPLPRPRAPMSPEALERLRKDMDNAAFEVPALSPFEARLLGLIESGKIVWERAGDVARIGPPAKTLQRVELTDDEKRRVAAAPAKDLGELAHAPWETHELELFLDGKRVPLRPTSGEFRSYTREEVEDAKRESIPLDYEKAREALAAAHRLVVDLVSADLSEQLRQRPAPATEDGAFELVEASLRRVLPDLVKKGLPPMRATLGFQFERGPILEVAARVDETGGFTFERTARPNFGKPDHRPADLPTCRSVLPEDVKVDVEVSSRPIPDREQNEKDLATVAAARDDLLGVLRIPDTSGHRWICGCRPLPKTLRLGESCNTCRVEGGASGARAIAFTGARDRMLTDDESDAFLHANVGLAERVVELQLENDRLRAALAQGSAELGIANEVVPGPEELEAMLVRARDDVHGGSVYITGAAKPILFVMERAVEALRAAEENDILRNTLAVPAQLRGIVPPRTDELLAWVEALPERLAEAERARKGQR
jgi:hypothetical protein